MGERPPPPSLPPAAAGVENQNESIGSFFRYYRRARWKNENVGEVCRDLILIYRARPTRMRSG